MADAVALEFIALQQALIGRYSLERELGRGGMGIVFLARDVALDRPVAIKLLPPAMAAQAGLRERFVREAQTAAKLSQPNIVPIHAVEQAGDLVWFAMAYVEGETLGERLRAKGPLTPHEAARMLQEVAWALAYAHGRGVVHRDVKPDNILLERGTGRAVVMDFGIAAAGGSATTEVLGTAQYISPEQANGEAVDGRSDLYSLGVVGFLALSGRLPFEAEDTATLVAMHLTRPAPPLASATPGLPRKLARAVDRCLAKNPADRFPSGEAMAEAVGDAVERRRELPVPVRLWLTKGQENKGVYLIWYVTAGPMFGAVVGAGVSELLGAAVGVAAGIKAWALTPLLLHGGYRTWRLRRLLATGYSLEDVKLAVRDAADRRREELSYEYGAEPPRWAKVVRGAMIASGATCVTMFGVIMVMPRTFSDAPFLVTFGAAASWFLTAVLQTVRPGRRITKDTAAELRVRFWHSRFGRWLERIARFGLRRRAVPAELTYRPTELAIGLAADALFETLPKDVRKELKELPRLLERLQRDAQLMRRTVDDLNGALAGLGEQGVAAQSQALRAGPGGEAGVVLADARERLRADLAKKRELAAARLAAAVAALESIRLNLLRLKAGTGTVGELTADLTAARAVQQRMDEDAKALEEVEALLRGARRSLTGELTPRASGAHGG